MTARISFKKLCQFSPRQRQQIRPSQYGTKKVGMAQVGHVEVCQQATQQRRHFKENHVTVPNILTSVPKSNHF